MLNIKLGYREHTLLREELHKYKHCQITFLTFSVTATGILLGLAVKMGSTPSLGAFYLIPLTILLPFWWIFFDKATSITRVVGYYRILEKGLLDPKSINNFMGWENSLREYRRRQANGTLIPPGTTIPRKPSFLSIFFLKAHTPYWVLTYYTFLGLSSLCWALSLYFVKSKGGYFVLIIAAILIIITAVRNAYLVRELTRGKKSYRINEKIWKNILC